MKKRIGHDVSTILVWVAFVIVILYFFLKIIGVIHSPVTIDLIALISGAYFVGRYAKRIDDTFKDVERVNNDLTKINNNCPIFDENKICR